MKTSLLQQIVGGTVGYEAYALLWRLERGSTPTLELLAGQVHHHECFSDLPPLNTVDDELLVLVPYAQLRERGYCCLDGGEKLQAMHVTHREEYPLVEALEAIPLVDSTVSTGDFDIDDAAYEAIVRQVIDDEIGRGEGANFVIKRTFTADFTNYAPAVALAAFRRLAQQETGAYWIFLFHTGDRTFIGASPERHISLDHGTATMNPISGTYRYPASGPTLSGVMSFLADAKEKDELYMVVDEELKMMAKFCPRGGRVFGPFLKEMSRLAHTEYFIEGRTSADPRFILRQTLFAPTVTGSPIENACRVIARNEPTGRGYYAGTLALIGRDQEGADQMDSAILIRTAEINAAGRMSISVGATIVRHSDPSSEAAETRAKAKALLAALGHRSNRGFANSPEVQAALSQRNGAIANFWLTEAEDRIRVDASLKGQKVLIVDAEDAFTAMLAQQLTAIGFDVTVKSYCDPGLLQEVYDLAVLGPGPGDPRDTCDPRIVSMRDVMRQMLARQQAFFAVCLSHQILCIELGLELVQRHEPNQGVQREIDFFGSTELVGFYNTFVAKCDCSCFSVRDDLRIEVSRDTQSNEVHALRGPRFASIQFHAESLLTQRGVDIMASSMKRVLAL
ncbi:anthranilate synthase family protein [Dyella sp. GSA-30]|uniref:anthranilate synthase family protein n=1 Tax=Dyella sp. GSA-30 TaxID=2994496 RepID=UPI002492A86D|nr:anthranilate synthase family protein [Dyella sp. GSA-30]BDU21157.1 phenazine-specific anthranilate synthase component I [Dyella sp. GSA-30]